MYLKKNLILGDIVVLNNKRKYLYVYDRLIGDYLFMRNGGYYMSPSHYNEHLKHYRFDEYDVIKIYSPVKRLKCVLNRYTFQYPFDKVIKEISSNFINLSLYV